MKEQQYTWLSKSTIKENEQSCISFSGRHMEMSTVCFKLHSIYTSISRIRHQMWLKVTRRHHASKGSMGKTVSSHRKVDLSFRVSL